MQFPLLAIFFPSSWFMMFTPSHCISAESSLCHGYDSADLRADKLCHFPLLYFQNSLGLF